MDWKGEIIPLMKATRKLKNSVGYEIPVIPESEIHNLPTVKRSNGALEEQVTSYDVEQFCVLYVAFGSAIDAYLTMLDLPIDRGNIREHARSAANLMARTGVQKRICELKGQKFYMPDDNARPGGDVVTVDSLSEELRIAWRLAIENGQAGQAVAATMAKAKLHNLIKDNVEVKQTHFVVEVPPVAPTTEAWLQTIGQAPPAPEAQIIDIQSEEPFDDGLGLDEAEEEAY